jgi:TatD DNase family protein
MELIDTHIHLNFPEFHPDLEAVVERMKTAGVIAAINIGTDAKTSEESVALAERFSWLSAAVGIHPHSAAEVDKQIDTIRSLAKHPKVVAIGEIGLDYFRNEVPAADQVRAFIAQLEIAIKAEKPVILHCRDAYGQVAAVLEDNYIPHLNGRLPGVIHSFTSTPAYAQQFLKLGFYIGINNIVAYPNSTGLQEAVKIIPLDRIVIETDSPYLPPAHLRGTRCEPAYVLEAARKIAELKELPLKQVIDATTANAHRLFKLNHD